MSLENYKYEMNRKTPDRAFVEETLRTAKKSMEQPKKKHEIWKSVGAVGLSAAVLVGAFFGAGAVRSFFENIEPIESDERIPDITADTITDAPDETDIDRITATDSELSVTPLSNPKYTVKADTPDGKVSLDENTTPAEMIACGVPVETENGLLGMQYLCEALKKYKDHEAFEFIFANVVSDIGNHYDYYNYDASDKLYDVNYNSNQRDTTYWEYQHRGYLSVNKYVDSHQHFAEWMEEVNGETAGITLCVENWQTNKYGIVTIYDTLGHTAEAIEEKKERFYEKMTTRTTIDGDLRMPLLSVIYNGKCLGKFRMNNFIEKIENGAEYAGVQYTDITTTEEYDERYYSIEYCNGVYSIFTMTNGLDGVFDTQYFDGYTVLDNEVVFDNGNAKYTFALSETPKADMTLYDELIHVYDCLRYGFYTDYSNDSSNLNISYDMSYIEQMFNEKLMDCIVINEEYSENGLNAVKITDYRYDYSSTDYAVAYLYLDPIASHLFTAEDGAIYWLDELTVETYDRGITVIERDGEQYIMLSNADLARFKDSGLGVEFDYSSGVRKWLISETLYKSQSVNYNYPS